MCGNPFKAPPPPPLPPPPPPPVAPPMRPKLKDEVSNNPDAGFAAQAGTGSGQGLGSLRIERQVGVNTGGK